jgi:hypothetical protein
LPVWNDFTSKLDINNLQSQLYLQWDSFRLYSSVFKILINVRPYFSLEINAVELVEFLSNIPGGHSDHDVIGITVGLVGFHL